MTKNVYKDVVLLMVKTLANVKVNTIAVVRMVIVEPVKNSVIPPMVVNPNTVSVDVVITSMIYAKTKATVVVPRVTVVPLAISVPLLKDVKKSMEVVSRQTLRVLVLK